ncbi:hypothetical protein ABGB14_02805 [Nonomuraea sp. B10E15]
MYGVYRSTWQTASRMPLRRAASAILAASGSLVAIGFSRRVW